MKYFDLSPVHPRSRWLPSLSFGKYDGGETGEECVMVGGGVVVESDSSSSSSTMWMGGVTIRGIGESMIELTQV